MKTLSTLVLLLACAGIVSADWFAPILVHQDEQYLTYSCVDAMVDDSGAFEGFIFSDPSNRRLVIHFEQDTITIESLPVEPCLTINRHNGMYLDIYVFGPDTATGELRLGKITLTGGTWPEVWITPTFAFADYGVRDYTSFYSLYFDKEDSEEFGIIACIRCLFSDTVGDTAITTLAFSTTMTDLDLNPSHPSLEANCVAHGDLNPSPGRETVFTRALEQNFGIGGEWGHNKTTAGVGLLNAAGDTLIEKQYVDALYPGVFIGDFDSTTPYDEVIVHGTAMIDSMGSPDFYTYAGCFSLAGSEPQELWLTLRAGQYPDYLTADQTQLVCGAGYADLYWIFNTATGEPTEDEYLDRELFFKSRWYEVGTPPIRRLVGLCEDTLFVYEFNHNPTAVHDDQSDLLPATFSLAQNYPNPFNGETVISFTNTLTQHLRLSIHNLLGQEVAVLHDAVTAAGETSVSWNGRDASGNDVASGVYFARLKADSGSREIKMMYVK